MKFEKTIRLCVLNVNISWTPTLSLGSSLQSVFGTKVIFAKSFWSILIDLLNLASKEYTIFPLAPLKVGGMFLKCDYMRPDESRFSSGCFMDIHFYKDIQYLFERNVVCLRAYVLE